MRTLSYTTSRRYFEYLTLKRSMLKEEGNVAERSLPDSLGKDPVMRSFMTQHRTKLSITSSAQGSAKSFEWLINNTDLKELFATPGLPPAHGTDSRFPLGRLALLREFGGKLRIFAIPGAGAQVALKPIHDALFAFLESLPSDYTHDQLRFRRDFLSGKFRGLASWSYDLTSATDLFPVRFQAEMLNRLLGADSPERSENLGDI